MRDRFKLFALVLAALTLLGLTGAATQAQDDVLGSVFRQINRARAEAGLPELARNPFLEASAQGHANDLLANGSGLGHGGSNGSNFQARIKWAGYNAAAVGENWASFRNLDLIMEFWLNDPPHRRNILSPKFADIGIGVAVRPNGGLIVVTDFGTQLSPEAAAKAQAAEQAAAEKAAAQEKKQAKPTDVPPTRKPKPTDVPPTRKPKEKQKQAPPPPAEPTRLPPPPPTVVQLALAQPAPVKPTIPPLRVRGKSAAITLQGNAFVKVKAVPKNPNGWNQFYGGILVLGGMTLIGVAVLGQRRRRLLY